MMRKSWFCAAAVLAVCAVFSGNAPASAETLAGFGADISGAYPETDSVEEEISESITEGLTEDAEEDTAAGAAESPSEQAAENTSEDARESITEDMTDEGPEILPDHEGSAGGRELWDAETAARAEKILAGHDSSPLASDSVQDVLLHPRCAAGGNQLRPSATFPFAPAPFRASPGATDEGRASIMPVAQ